MAAGNTTPFRAHNKKVNRTLFIMFTNRGSYQHGVFPVNKECKTVRRCGLAPHQTASINLWFVSQTLNDL